MAGKVNPIKKEQVKQALLNGKSARQALRESNYSEGHIRRSTANKVVKDSMNEIIEELKEKDITVEFVINRLNEDRQLALKKKDYATATRVDELLGKFLAMFTDKVRSEGQMTVKGLNKDDIDELRGHLEAINQHRLN